MWTCVVQSLDCWSVLTTLGSSQIKIVLYISNAATACEVYICQAGM